MSDDVDATFGEDNQHDQLITRPTTQ